MAYRNSLVCLPLYTPPSSPPHCLHRLWLNGGPGCSSFDGWVYEQGPFKLALSHDRKQVTLQDNPFAWNKVANMIFLDSPSRES